MSEQPLPPLRVGGFAAAWETRTFESQFSFLRHNSLSRADLTSDDTGVRNIHYGDILVRFGDVIDVQVDVLPFVADPSNPRLGDVLRDGDVVFADAAEDSTVGKCSEVRNSQGEVVVAGLHTIPTRPNQDFGKGFLGHALNSGAFHDQLIPLMQGSKVSSISVSALKGCTISFPSEPEQHEIGALFSRLDSQMSTLGQDYQQLVQAKSALMQRMFPQGHAEEPELRLEGFKGSWDRRKLGSLGKARGGFGFPHTAQRGSAGIPFYKVSDMNLFGNERAMTRANNYVTADQVVRHGWRPFQDVPAIIFAKVGAAVMLGRKRVVHHPFLVDNNMIGVSLDQAEWDVQFAQTTFDLLDLTRLVQVGALPSFNPPAVEAMEVQVPRSRDEQQAISAIFRRLDNLIEAKRLYLSKLQPVKAALLQKMFV
ncbi:restriction endonuclease subunit S [Kineococcus arenarius]|uniref:restriction endonuclease subunit S n=1 Tax=unclassified Kineococcus TaxID=2621656 RepID=UPI003D7CCA23